MIRAVHTEWTKLRTIGGATWLLLGIVVTMIGLGVAASAWTICRGAGCGVDPVRTSLTGTLIGQAGAAVFGVLIMGGEYSTGMIVATLTAIPRRLAVLAAKAVMAVVPVIVAGVVAVYGSLIGGRSLLPSRGINPANGFAATSMTDPLTLRAAVGTVLYLALVALIGLGVATAVRNSAAAIGLVLAVLYLFPILITVITDPDWQRHLRQIAPSSAGLAIQSTIDLGGLAIGAWTGVGVVGLWALGSLTLGAWILARRSA